ncbi:unannotated protein [freshwater metagenome]|uniref:Unannotated protein n=1 Tax=freshwater metagenome TaxID=449393 RepID=A0A6J6E647_9ZZZZ
MLTQNFLSVDGFDVVSEQERGLRNAARLQAREAGHGGEQDDQRDNPRGARLAGNEVTYALPQATNALETGNGVLRCDFELLLPKLRQEGPERSATENDQQSWQEGDSSQECESDAECGNGAECLVGVEVREEQRQEREHDGRSGGEDRLERTAQRASDCSPLRLHFVQRLLEAGNEEQGVVGGSTNDENRKDSLGLPRDLDDVVQCEVVDAQNRAGERKNCSQQHQERQQDGSVNNQQNHEDREQCHEQKNSVDSAEAVDEVSEQTGRTRHIRGVAGRRFVLDHLAEERDVLEQHFAARLKENEELHGGTVFRVGRAENAGQFALNRRRNASGALHHGAELFELSLVALSYGTRI